MIDFRSLILCFPCGHFDVFPWNSSPFGLPTIPGSPHSISSSSSNPLSPILIRNESSESFDEFTLSPSTEPQSSDDKINKPVVFQLPSHFFPFSQREATLSTAMQQNSPIFSSAFSVRHAPEANSPERQNDSLNMHPSVQGLPDFSLPSMMCQVKNSPDLVSCSGKEFENNVESKLSQSPQQIDFLQIKQEQSPPLVEELDPRDAEILALREQVRRKDEEIFALQYYMRYMDWARLGHDQFQSTQSQNFTPKTQDSTDAAQNTF